MTIWFTQAQPEDLEKRVVGTMVPHVGIEYLEVGDDFIRAKMPVDKRTTQPMGILHGGASCVLAETLGSVAANMCVDPTKEFCVGMEINANHVRSANSGFVYGTVKPVHIGRSTHIWDIRIENEESKLVCISRLTMAVRKF
ncbi:MAG: hotdog fold thioesterase [bacterium]|nr:hotdog fold thioesterase [bacterium]